LLRGTGVHNRDQVGRDAVNVHSDKEQAAHATNTPAGQVQLLEARHRVQARVEPGIRTGEDTGLVRLPSRDYAINTAWCHAVAVGIDLRA